MHDFNPGRSFLMYCTKICVKQRFKLISDFKATRYPILQLESKQHGWKVCISFGTAQWLGLRSKVGDRQSSD
uniref:Putative ovule protein n=1 Tax=Solanum chacoense TaxID=4108 RepID=A0A0V0GLG7_SOLCH